MRKDRPRTLGAWRSLNPWSPEVGKRGAQPLGGLQGQFDAGARPGIEPGVDEIERDDIAQRRMARVVVGHHCL